MAAERALSGVRVVDLSQGIAGAYCTKLLSDFGADVVKVDLADGKNSLPWDAESHPERSGLSLYLNTGKRKLGPGAEALIRLLDEADVLVEDFGPGGLEGLGLSSDRLSEKNAGLIVTSVSPFGPTGPYAPFKATSLTLEALGGWAFQAGDPEGMPARANSELLSMSPAGIYAAIGTLAALFWRRAGGEGQRVVVSAMDALIATTRYHETTYAYNQQVIKRTGSYQRPTYRMVQCTDGFAAMCVTTDAQWELACSLIGAPEMATDPTLATALDRMAQRDRIDPLVERWSESSTKAEVFHSLQEWRIPAGMVCTTEEQTNLAQHRAREYFVECEHRSAGTLSYPGAPFKMSETPWQIDHAPVAREGDGVWKPSAGSPTAPLAAMRVCADHKQEQRQDTGDSHSGRLPLAGIRVLDLTTFWAGPLAATVLADMGAEVIKIEAIQRLDHWRGLLADTTAEKPYETSPVFNAVHRNKHSLTLNLTTARGVELFKELVKRSDVVIENYSPRVMPQFGLSYPALKELNPAVIMLSTTGFGSNGPWRNYISMATVAEAVGGLSTLTGYSDGYPGIHAAWPADSLAAVHGATAILMALVWRQRTGRGQHIDLSQTEVTTSTLADAFMDYSLHGRVRNRMGNRHQWMAPHGCYPAKGEDEWVAIAVRTEEEWHSLVRALGNPAWGRAERFVTMEKRWANQEELDGLLGESTRREDKHVLMERLQREGVAAGAVLGPKDILADKHLAERGFFENVDRQYVGVKPYPGLGIDFSRTPCRIRKPAPCLGEHNEELLERILGLPKEELAALERERVIGREPAV